MQEIKRIKDPMKILELNGFRLKRDPGHGLVYWDGVKNVVLNRTPSDFRNDENCIREIKKACREQGKPFIDHVVLRRRKANEPPQEVAPAEVPRFENKPTVIEEKMETPKKPFDKEAYDFCVTAKNEGKNQTWMAEALTSLGYVGIEGGKLTQTAISYYTKGDRDFPWLPEEVRRQARLKREGRPFGRQDYLRVKDLMRKEGKSVAEVLEILTNEFVTNSKGDPLTAASLRAYMGGQKKEWNQDEYGTPEALYRPYSPLDYKPAMEALKESFQAKATAPVEEKPVATTGPKSADSEFLLDLSKIINSDLPEDLKIMSVEARFERRKLGQK